MRKSILIALLVIFAVVMGVFVSELFRSDPKYNGKRLSAWFEQYYRSGWQVGNFDDSKREESMNAMRAIGTDSVPYLLSKLYSTNADSSFRTNLHAWLNRLPASIRPKRYVEQEVIRSEAFYALMNIGPAGDVVPGLVTNRLYDSQFDVRARTLYLLSALKMGTNHTLPILRGMLQSASGTEQLLAASCLRSLEKKAAPALPELVELIKNEKSYAPAVSIATRILWQFDDIDLSLVPALQARLAKLGETSEALETAVTLVRIDTGQAEGLDLLLKVAADPKHGLRSRAIDSLREVGKNAKRAGPVLYEIAMSDSAYVWSSAAWTLFDIGETNMAMAVGYHRLGSPHRDYQLTGARLLLAGDATNDTAITRLLELARDYNRSIRTTVQVDDSAAAIQELSRLRPMPSTVRQTLEAISTEKNHPGRAEAQKVLKILKKEEEKSNAPGQ